MNTLQSKAKQNKTKNNLEKKMLRYQEVKEGVSLLNKSKIYPYLFNSKSNISKNWNIK